MLDLDLNVINRVVPTITHWFTVEGLELAAGKARAEIRVLKNGNGFRYRVIGAGIWLYHRGTAKGALRRARKLVRQHAATA